MTNVSDYQPICSSTERTFGIHGQTSIRLGNGLYAIASFFEGGPGVPHRITLRIMQNATMACLDKHVIFEQIKVA
jgi:hypothetical protein